MDWTFIGHAMGCLIDSSCRTTTTDTSHYEPSAVRRPRTTLLDGKKLQVINAGHGWWAK
jgi:hypothetical protein